MDRRTNISNLAILSLLSLFWFAPLICANNGVNANQNGIDESVFEVYDSFCYNNPKKPFYQRISDGAICCRGKQLTGVSIQPDVYGECAISTKVDPNGALDASSLVGSSNSFRK